MIARFALVLAPWLVMAAPAAEAEAPADTVAQAPAPKETKPRARISGLTFGDVYYNAVGDPTHRYSASGADSGKVNIDASGQPITRDLNGLQIRRIYFQLDNDLSETWSTRVRFEIDSRALTSDGKIGAFIKNAYLEGKDLWPRSNAWIGMMDTPTFQNADEVWGYRSIERTIGDFLGIASSSDLGVRASGTLDEVGHFGYTAMIGDGTGQRPENNRQKRFYFAFPLKASTAIVEPYIDYEDGPEGRDRVTYRMLAGVQPGPAAIGFEYYDRVSHAPGGNGELRAGSVFARWKASNELGLFGRADYTDPNVRTPDRVRLWLWIGGVDWTPYENVHLMPNFELTNYRARGAAVPPAWHDLQVRLTFYYRFEGPAS